MPLPFQFTALNLKCSASRGGTAPYSLQLLYLFEVLELYRASTSIDVDNPASYYLLARLGFRRECHFVENIWFNGAWGSEYCYALPGREWQERHKITSDRVLFLPG